MSIEAQGETPEHRAQREANTTRMEAQLRETIAKHTVPPSPDLCACGHGRAMHFDEDGDHNGPCLWQVHNDAPFCKCDMWHRKPSEDEFLGVPVSEWRQIAAEINCRRGPDGSMLKRFRELLEVSDMRAALLKKRSAPSPSPAPTCALKGCHRDAVPKHAHCLQHEAELMLEVGMLTHGLTAADVRAVLREDAQSYDDAAMAKALNERLFQRRQPSPSPALAALVEAGDTMRENYLFTLSADCDGIEDDPPESVQAWDRARAALPQEKPQ